jgi:hypothetical protein
VSQTYLVPWMEAWPDVRLAAPQAPATTSTCICTYMITIIIYVSIAVCILLRVSRMKGLWQYRVCQRVHTLVRRVSVLRV